MTQTVAEIHGNHPDWLWYNYHCTLDKELQRQYGISCADYNRLLKEQGGVCAICGLPPGKYKLAVDHNPETGEIRGLIHQRHNRMLTTAIVAYILEPPARKFGLKVSKAKQRKLDARRAARKKREPSEQVATQVRKRHAIEEAAATDVISYDEAIKQLLGEHA